MQPTPTPLFPLGGNHFGGARGLEDQPPLISFRRVQLRWLCGGGAQVSGAEVGVAPITLRRVVVAFDHTQDLFFTEWGPGCVRKPTTTTGVGRPPDDLEW